MTGDYERGLKRYRRSEDDEGGCGSIGSRGVRTTRMRTREGLRFRPSVVFGSLKNRSCVVVKYRSSRRCVGQLVHLVCCV